MKQLLSVGIKNGEFDFEVSGVVANLSLEEMQQFRAMIVTAIGTMEDVWRRWQEENYGTGSSPVVSD